MTKTTRTKPPKEQRCIEWTGAGGDYFLAVVVEHDAVVSEKWGTRADVMAWMDEEWPRLPRKFAPMVYSPVQRQRPASTKKRFSLPKSPLTPIAAKACAV